MAFRRLISACCGWLILLGLGVVPSAAQTAPVEVVFATQPGEPAYDNDPFGGNPFASAFIAAIRTTGHGSEVNGMVVILPPDAQHSDDIMATSIMLEEAAAALRAKFSNRLFHAGCRVNPLELTLPSAG